MQFDAKNPVVKLCAKGMEQEGSGNPAEAKRLFMQAWEQAASDLEKFTAAHYVARHQPSILQKLQWDETALRHALALKDENMKGALPSLYLNIAKCYEDLGEKDKARIHYEQALSYSVFLANDGYGSMIRSGIQKGLDRIA
jgi:tetratricopeptide (TPR) repeat protein